MAARTTSTKAKSAPVEEPDEDEFEDAEDMEDTDEDLDELEEVGDEEDDRAEGKPKAKRSTAKATAAKAASAPKFGSAELAAYVTETTGENFDGRGIRMLLRKLASTGKLDRQVGETRDPSPFTGPNDPTVKAVVAMVKSGEAKAMKQAGLEKVKEQANYEAGQLRRPPRRPRSRTTRSRRSRRPPSSPERSCSQLPSLRPRLLRPRRPPLGVGPPAPPDQRGVRLVNAQLGVVAYAGEQPDREAYGPVAMVRTRFKSWPPHWIGRERGPIHGLFRQSS